MWLFNALATVSVILFMQTSIVSATMLLTVTSPESSRLKVTWGEDAGVAIDELVTLQPELEPGKPFAVVIKNLSDTQVIALTIRWTWKSADGVGRTYDQRTDALLGNSAGLVLAARNQTIVLPGIFSPRRPSGGIGVTGFKPIEHALQRFEGAPSVNASLDCVIFADGLVLGPDETRTVEGIRIRQTVAKEVANVVLTAISSNEDVATAVQRYLDATKDKTTADRQEVEWRHYLAYKFKARSFPPSVFEDIAKGYLAFPNLPVRQ